MRMFPHPPPAAQPPFTRLRSAARFAHDWRIRTLVPVVLVNLLAFAGLYALMYHFAISNVVQAQKAGASVLFDDLTLIFKDPMLQHRAATVAGRLARHAEVHKLEWLTIFAPDGRVLTSAGSPPSRSAIEQVARVLRKNDSAVSWWLTENHAVLFTRGIANERECQSCHEPGMPRLGVVQASIDLRQPIAEARVRLRQKFVFAGVAWLTILGILLFTARHVIGRPLAAMEKTISAMGTTAPERHDLDALAGRVHDSLWGMIRAQREREEDITRHMARAEQLAALGQLAAGLTHEIKNPLVGVAAALELLRDEGGTLEENHVVYDLMLAELARVTNTVGALLRLASPQPPQRVEVDIGRLVQEVTSLFGARLRHHGVFVKVDIAEHLPMVQVDPGLVSQLLMNLLTNAMQATDSGGTITVFVAPFPMRDGIALAVSDTGRGISAAHIERIFDPFFTTKEEGTGLGLPICKQIVDQHGGTIRIDSEPGTGTRVMVLLPDANAVEEDASYGAAAAG